MKKTFFIFLLSLFQLAGYADGRKIIAQSEGSITFVVDENLPPMDYEYQYYDGDTLAKILIDHSTDDLRKYHIITSSFADESQIVYMGSDVFYNCLINAYANHRSVTISPDMIWLLISQGFARYVNAHEEQMRPLLVNHTGKKTLYVRSLTDLMSEHADWPQLISDFTAQIDKNTKGDIAQTITADFTTTTSVERIASQITLMECVKGYFDYVAVYVLCGIPSVTLKGTPEDWRQVLDKTKRLEQYGLSRWVGKLKPILKECIRASEGHPNQFFWQSIVKVRKSNLQSGDCAGNRPTKLDGWFLKLFPDENGKVENSVYWRSHTMPVELVGVDFKYQMVEPVESQVISETPMELCAGFIGAEIDTLTNTLIPKIGWLVRTVEDE